jgi:hypothetical protein
MISAAQVHNRNRSENVKGKLGVRIARSKGNKREMKTDLENIPSHVPQICESIPLQFPRNALDWTCRSEQSPELTGRQGLDPLARSK